MFDLYYKKNDNSALFESFNNIGLYNVQNYIPLYKQFFSLKESNYKNLNLNHHFHIIKVEPTNKRNKFNCIITDGHKKEKKLCFFKFSPLLDPVKYMVGKYKDLGETKKITLPELNENICHKKVVDPNNSAYVDSFFSYLTSQLYHNCYFPHGLDFFGSFLGVQKKFIYNIADDIDYLHDSTYFHKNQNEQFKIENMDMGMLMDFDTRNYKKKLNIGDRVANKDVSSINNDDFKQVFHLADISNARLTEPDLVFEFDLPTSRSRKTDSTCSSRSSNTNTNDSCSEDGNDDSFSDDDDSEENSEENESSSNCTTLDSDIEINSVLFNFPTQIICLECMDGTLDSLLNEENEMSTDEWRACLFQIVIMLIVYQKVFHFTHNDLHTNNIMFQKTEKQYLYYRYKQRYYKVPTFGRIFKIIDFGRAIYKYKGRMICSDSYHSKGDAATQYNFEPYFNSKKPRLEPNMSFDLCRLACSLFDYFVEDMNNIEPIDYLAKLMVEWTQDDKGRNILYKKNGDERYPDFKLYKMIARTVHKHTPQAQFEGPFFNKYIVGRKKISKKAKIVDIDKMPCLALN
jgi:hypothetical protein